jgi:hypothetical protein
MAGEERSTRRTRWGVAGSSPRPSAFLARGAFFTLLAAALIVAAPSRALAQVNWGAHAVHASDAFGGTYGAGLRLGIALPALPFDLMASGEYFFPDCPAGQGGCGLRGFTLDANFRMAFPVVRPYITAGLAYRSYSPGGGGSDDSATGPAVGVGVDLSLGGIRAFGETRYEFVSAPENEFVWRLGLLFGL